MAVLGGGVRFLTGEVPLYTPLSESPNPASGGYRGTSPIRKRPPL